MDGDRVYTVSELTHQIKTLLEGRYRRLWVEGEVSNSRLAPSGHLYFTLKDESSQLRCAMFRYSSRGMRFRVEDGLKVLATGDVSVYERRGEYQLIVERLEPRGRGELALAFEQLKERLEREGLFRPERKRKLPLVPGRIGVVTSPTGAAIRDILNIIERRFSTVHVVLYPVRVQGEGAADEIVEGIDYFSASRSADVVIVGRGGGSIEDLWAFNEERVARAIHSSQVPVISAVGHEIDFTIADFVADCRAPTPSAAAELVVAESERLARDISSFGERIALSMQARLRLARERVDAARGRYGFRLVEDRIRQQLQRVDELGDRLGQAVGHLVELEGNRLEGLQGKLNELSPLGVLSRGYSLALKLPGRELLRDAAAVEPGDRVQVRLARGEFRARVEEPREED